MLAFVEGQHRFLGHVLAYSGLVPSKECLHTLTICRPANSAGIPVPVNLHLVFPKKGKEAVAAQAAWRESKDRAQSRKLVASRVLTTTSDREEEMP